MLSPNSETFFKRPTQLPSKMADKTVVILVPPGKSLKIVKWKIRKDVFVSIGQIILLYNDESENVSELRKFKATEAGTVKSLAAVEGEIVQPGSKLVELEECSHPTVMKDMCAECGADLRCDLTIAPNSTASVPMVHSVPELKVSEEEAQRLGREDSERLLRDRKLVLLVDLDQTLVHTTNDNIPANIKDVYHFQLRGWGRWYHSRLRPGTASFLLAVAPLFELHICTFGARAYAHKVARLLDPKAHLFSHRILSRDECFDIQSKTPNLRALFPCGDNLVCIIDDREDVWNRAPNLIQVRPYHFFEHTGDIHAPPGLGKTDSDREGQGLHIDIQDLNDKNVSKYPAIKNGATEDLPLLESANTDEEKSNDTTETAISVAPLELMEQSASHIAPGTRFYADTQLDSDIKVQEGTKFSAGVEIDAHSKMDVDKVESDTKVEAGIEIDANNKVETDADSETEAIANVESDTDINADNKIEADSEIEADTNTTMEIPVIPALDTMLESETKISMDKELAPDTNSTLVSESSHEGKSSSVSRPLPESNALSDSEMNFEDIDPDKVLEKEIDEITSLNQENSIETDLNSDLTPELDAEINHIDKIKDGDITANEPVVETDVPVVPHTKWKTTEDGMIEVEDQDDYLLYLEDILKRIHKFFYEVYDAMEAGSVPDLKSIIPQVKGQVLAGTSLVFSGLVPTYQRLEHSRAYLVARSLGAQVTQDLTPTTTHLVAVRPGTAKVHACGRVSGTPPLLVTPSWLWACAERWARCEERLFPLRGSGKGASARRPPAHCASPPHQLQEVGGAPRKRTPSGRFMDTINPLLSFSSDDIADMDKEVEDIINESDESDGEDGDEEGQVFNADQVAEGEDTQERELKKVLRGDVPSESESEESMSGDHPRGWKRRAPKDAAEDDEPPSSRFRRGEALPSDGPDASDSDTCGSREPPDEGDDGQWNLMGAALEREFLGLDD